VAARWLRLSCPKTPALNPEKAPKSPETVPVLPLPSSLPVAVMFPVKFWAPLKEFSYVETRIIIGRLTVHLRPRRWVASSGR